MSHQLIQTGLPGYDGPIQIPSSIMQLLYEAAEQRGLNGILLENASKRITGYQKHLRPTTVDGYGWFWGEYFVVSTISNGEVAVLFPWSQDWDKRDNSTLDRAIAVYAKGNPSRAEIMVLLTTIAANIKDVFLEEAEAAALTK